MKIIQDFKKRRAIKSYITKLPRMLAKDYGASKTYTPRQVRSAIERSNLDAFYSCFGIAMFSSRAEFEQFHSENGESCDFDSMRAEIAHAHFGGNADFTFEDIADPSSEHGPGADHGAHHDAGGADGHGGH
jgi:hypothetical protein